MWLFLFLGGGWGRRRNKNFTSKIGSKSDDINLIANEILPGETMADIGTDHGFLPLYLWEQKICPKGRCKGQLF